jgi:hypothetical protein
MPDRAIETNIADALNLIIQIEPRPGARFVAAVLAITSIQLLLNALRASLAQAADSQAA